MQSKHTYGVLKIVYTMTNDFFVDKDCLRDAENRTQYSEHS